MKGLPFREGLWGQKRQGQSGRSVVAQLDGATHGRSILAVRMGRQFVGTFSEGLKYQVKGLDLGLTF